jgi:hypothetical protein
VASYADIPPSQPRPLAHVRVVRPRHFQLCHLCSTLLIPEIAARAGPRQLNIAAGCLAFGCPAAAVTVFIKLPAGGKMRPRTITECREQGQLLSGGIPSGILADGPRDTPVLLYRRAALRLTQPPGYAKTVDQGLTPTLGPDLQSGIKGAAQIANKLPMAAHPVITRYRLAYPELHRLPEGS